MEDDTILDEIEIETETEAETEEKAPKSLADHGKQTMTVEHKDTKEKVEISYDYGNDVYDAIDRFGADVVFYNYVIGAKDSLRNKLSALIRHQENRVSAEKAREMLANWKPGVGQVRGSKDPVATASKVIDTMSEEQLNDLLAKIQARRQAANAG